MATAEKRRKRLRRLPAACVDRGLWAQRDEGDRRAVPALLADEKVGADRAVADPVDGDVARPLMRNVEPAYAA